MWDEALDWLLPIMVHHELPVLKPLCEPMVLAEMSLLFSAPLDVTLPHNPTEDFLHKKFPLPIMVARTKHCGCCCSPWYPALHCLLDGQDNVWWKFLAANCVQLMCLPGKECHRVFSCSCPVCLGWLRQSYQAHIYADWYCLCISWLTAYLHWWKIVGLFLDCCPCPMVLMPILSDWIPTTLLWWNTQS